MDIISLIVSVASLFNDVVNDLEYIQVGRGYHEEYETNILKLDCARLRLSRWGKAVGINHRPELVKNMNRSSSLEANFSSAKKLFEKISALIEEAKKSASKAEISESPDNEFGPATSYLHHKMDFLTGGRQSVAAISTKVRWVVWERNQLKRLLDEISKLTDYLTDLFPHTKESQEETCRTEELRSFLEILYKLQDASKSQDKFLHGLISDILEPSNPLTQFNNERNHVSSQANINHGAINTSYGSDGGPDSRFG